MRHQILCCGVGEVRSFLVCILYSIKTNLFTDDRIKPHLYELYIYIYICCTHIYMYIIWTTENSNYIEYSCIYYIALIYHMGLSPFLVLELNYIFSSSRPY